MDKSSPLHAQCGPTVRHQGDKDHKKGEGNLTAKDGLFIATECHLALFPDEDGDTALHLAAVQGDLEACRKLVELFRIAGKSIDVRNNLLQTPLHVAVITNNKDIVKLLVSNGSGPGNPDRYGSTAYHLCAKFDHHECFVEILDNIGRPPLLNTRDYEGQTALHVAVHHCSEKTFRLLISNGADIDAKDNKGGRTPLIYAIEKNEKGFVEALLERDASVSQQTYSGDTALHIASGRGLQDIVRLLLRRGADATMKNTHFETPMSLAASPMLSDMLRNQYRTSPDTKMITIDSHSAFIARNLPNTMTSHCIKINSGIDREALPKRSLSLKMERPVMENDGATPAKRLRMIENNISQSSLNGTYGIFPGVKVKHEYIEPASEGPAPSMMTVVDEVEREGTEDDIESTKASDSFDDHVEIAMEEVEVSAEEEIATRSDEDDKTGDSPSLLLHHENGKPVQEQPYTHKLKQYSINLMNKGTTVTASKPQDTQINKDLSESKPVTTLGSQIAGAAAMPKELSATSEGKRGGPFLNISEAVSEKSKSVPNSPQPAEANLYQLAREGLAVAAMANSINAQQGTSQDFGLSNYLKARPSRQAKIKSGTEELQNLALQGLAVAAMNAQFENPTVDDVKRKAADDIEVKPCIPMDFKSLNSPANQRKDSQPPLLLRSNSMPLKPMHETPPSPYIQHSSQGQHISSNRALLALAHANARKEHVGQAVSAISMGKSQINGGSKFFSTSQASDISDVTRQNLRQAIMVKNTMTPQSPNVKVNGNASAGESIPSQQNGTAEKRIPMSSSDSISIKLLHSITENDISVPAVSIRTPATVTNSSPEAARKKSPEPLAVFNVTIPRTSQYNLNSVSNRSKPATTSQNVASIIHSSMGVVGTTAKTTPAPTHTVAPLQMPTNHNMSIIRSEAGPLYSVASVANAPLAAYRVATTISSPKSLSTTAVEQATSMSSERVVTMTPGIPQHAIFSTTPGSSGSSVAGTPVTVALSIQQPQILSQPPLHVAQPPTSFVQPQIAYIPHGKDLIPVVLPPSALQPQLQYSTYPTLTMHSAQNSDKLAGSVDVTENGSNPRRNETYMSSIAKLSPVHPNFPTLPFPMQPTQIRGLYPLPSPLYGSPPQLNLLQHQQFIIDAYLHHQQQSLLAQGRLTSPQSALTSPKPVAAVSAFPVQQNFKTDSAKPVTSDEQPLNLSKKMEQSQSDGEEPLNLMKTHRAQETCARGSVIKSAISEKKEPQNKDTADHARSMDRSPNRIPANVAVGQAHHGVYLPPPVIINPSAVPAQVTNSSGLSTLSLPPIHYVNGMPFILGMPPQM